MRIAGADETAIMASYSYNLTLGSLRPLGHGRWSQRAREPVSVTIGTVRRGAVAAPSWEEVAPVELA
jgi:hypothetical protein